MKKNLLLLFLASTIISNAQSTWVQRLAYTWSTIYVWQDSVCGVRDAVATPDGYLFLIAKLDLDLDYNLIQIPKDGGVILSSTLVAHHGLNVNTYAEALRATQDSGCVVLRNYDNTVGDPYGNSFVEKYSKTGSLQWTTNFGNTSPNVFRWGYDIIQSSSGSYYVFIRDSLYTLDNSGAVISGTDAVGGKQMFELSNGDLLVRTDSSIIRTDLSGNVAWTYSSVSSSDFVSFSSYGAFICGATQVTKVDAATGGAAWTSSILSLPVSSIDATSDGGVIISYGMQLSAWSFNVMDGTLTKFDSSGNLQWSKTYTFPHYGLSCVKQLPSGDYLTGGTFMVCMNWYDCGYNPFVAVVDSSGNGTLDSTVYVWPGDVDGNDTILFAQDGLLIGIALGATGFGRENYNFNNNFVQDAELVSDCATLWPQYFGNGRNYCYADRNGDGVVDTVDLTYFAPMLEPINISFDLKQSASSQTNTLPDFNLVPQYTTVLPGDTMRLYIVAGASTPVDALYDIAWVITFDPYLIDPSYFKVTPLQSDFGTPGADVIDYTYYQMGYGGVLASLFARTDHNDVLQLHDTIGVIEFLSNANIDQATDFNVGFTQFGASTYAAQNVSFNFFGASISIDPFATSMNDVTADPVIYPNPSSQNLTVKTFLTGEKRFEIADMPGKILKTFKSSASVVRIPTDNLENGTYFLMVSSNGAEKVAKFIVEH